jgi:hypothetical protein
MKKTCNTRTSGVKSTHQGSSGFSLGHVGFEVDEVAGLLHAHWKLTQTKYRATSFLITMNNLNQGKM